jgi:hypothetical protein
MSEIIYGIYEQVINGIIHDNLNRIEDELIEKNIQVIDSAESTKILAVYLSHILCEVLDYIGDGETVVKDRVDLCNSIIQHITDCIEKGYFSFKTDSLLTKRIKSFLIEQDAKMLLALVDSRSHMTLKGLGSMPKPISFGVIPDSVLSISDRPTYPNPR